MEEQIGKCLGLKRAAQKAGEFLCLAIGVRSILKEEKRHLQLRTRLAKANSSGRASAFCYQWHKKRTGIILDAATQ